jgi:hypothetical protein
MQKWPIAITAHLWPYAVTYVTHILNDTPLNKTNITNILNDKKKRQNTKLAWKYLQTSGESQHQTSAQPWDTSLCPQQQIIGRYENSQMVNASLS